MYAFRCCVTLGALFMLSTRLPAAPSPPIDDGIFLFRNSNNNATGRAKTQYVAVVAPTTGALVQTEAPPNTNTAQAEAPPPEELHCDSKPSGVATGGQICAHGCAMWSDLMNDGNTRPQSPVGPKFASGVAPASRCCASPVNDKTDYSWCYCALVKSSWYMKCSDAPATPTPAPPPTPPPWACVTFTAGDKKAIAAGTATPASVCIYNHSAVYTNAASGNAKYRGCGDTCKCCGAIEPSTCPSAYPDSYTGCAKGGTHDTIANYCCDGAVTDTPSYGAGCQCM